MPYKRVDPVPNETMDNDRWVGSVTVFEKFREIWRIGRDLGNEEIKYTARLAFSMAYRMHMALMKNEEYRLSGENVEFITKRNSVRLVDESDMKKMRWLGHFQVCEKCRVIWRIGRGLKNITLMDKAREAMTMTKMMNEELKRYKAIRESDANEG